LLEVPHASPPARDGAALFGLGLPELLVCSHPRPLLQVFEYFWPLTKEEFLEFERAATIHWTLDSIEGPEDLQRFREWLKSPRDAALRRGACTAVVFTMNGYTRHWASTVASACRDAHVDELVVFKDPTVSPYLCDHDSLQKGFRRPPP
jgi:hypothetical protein